MPRYWGFWTRGKLDLLRRYLDAFTTAAKRQDEIVYLDLFGGQPENRERHTEEVLDGSARIALATGDAPFTRLRFFELEPYATRLRTAIAPSSTGRDVVVTAGDCNARVGQVLAELAPFNWAPTFAFVDPNGPDVHWSTLRSLSEFKKAGLAKTEMWLLLAAGMFIRTLRKDGSVREDDAARLDLMYGSDQWRSIYEARLAGDLDPGQAREEYVNLMRWRLQRVLGYRWTHSLEIFNEGGASIYHMLFATDHEVGNKIMTSLYNTAADEFPRMRLEARQLRARRAELDAGVQSLFGYEFVVPTAPRGQREKLYTHLEPWTPYGSGGVC